MSEKSAHSQEEILILNYINGYKMGRTITLLGYRIRTNIRTQILMKQAQKTHRMR